MDLEGQNLDDLNGNFDYDSQLQKIRSIGAVTISSELFEKVYTLRYKANVAKLVQPRDPAVGAFSQRLANPTPLAFQG